MKTARLLAFVFLTGCTGWSQSTPAKGPSMLELLQPALPGVNSAARPWPKVDWVERTRDLKEDAHRHPERTNLIFDGDSITDWWRTASGFPTWNGARGGRGRHLGAGLELHP